MLKTVEPQANRPEKDRASLESFWRAFLDILGLRNESQM